MNELDILRHAEKCLICKHKLGEEVDYFKAQGFSYDEIAHELNEKYNLGITGDAVKRHYKYASRIRLTEDGLQDIDLDEKYNLDLLDSLPPKEKVKFLNNIAAKALARLTLLYFEMAKPKRYFNMPTNGNLYALSKALDAISRIYSDTSKMMLEAEKYNEDELLKKSLEIAYEIGLLTSVVNEAAELTPNQQEVKAEDE